jgi:hypothetical protein
MPHTPKQLKSVSFTLIKLCIPYIIQAAEICAHMKVLPFPLSKAQERVGYTVFQKVSILMARVPAALINNILLPQEICKPHSASLP